MRVGNAAEAHLQCNDVVVVVVESALYLSSNNNTVKHSAHKPCK